ncbi:MAG: sigma-54-dependent Fis family transcriptional regulator, partial [Deltaproteobacteria bacterium]|nr:sigma-54-dependent Fis family transcriptional regulator [Deltaproteobacteria bacterium]
MHLTAASMRSLLEDLKSCSPECALVALPEGDVASIEEAIAVIKAADENLPIMVLLTSPSLQEVITVMKAGVYDCFAFPIDAERLGHAIANAVRLYRLTKKVYLLEQQMGSRSPFEGMVGTSQAMQAVFMLIKTVAKSQATVFIHGESGTGKELVAKALHRLSGREKKPFVDINCGAIPRQLLENELFGHERGAYTGADRRSIGSVERAHEGTLFLDEISEMDPALQVKLLRFLQERTFTRVGGNEPLSVNVRIVAATNRNLQGEVAAGRFREDLYYRLNVVPIELP